MSLLSAEVHAELTQLLQALQSADNGIRSQAEEHLQNSWTGTRPEVLLMGLAEQIQGAGDNAVSASNKALAKALLREPSRPGSRCALAIGSV